MSKILIIEDDPYVLRFYDNLFRLSNPNYQVVTAANGELGVSSAKADPPDLILLDIVMPGIDGIDVLKELKKDPALQQIPVIILTNINDTVTIRKCIDFGASGFLIKSDTDPKQLVTKIEEYLANITI